MSYRAFKRLMGETSLERKCRFLFGGGLMLLITGSFYLHARQNENVVHQKNIESARRLVIPALVEMHVKAPESEAKLNSVFAWITDSRNSSTSDASKKDSPFQNSSQYFENAPLSEKAEGANTIIYRVDPASDSPHKRAPDTNAQIALEALRKDFPNTSEIDEIVTVENEKIYHFYTGIRARKKCLECHHHKSDDIKEGELMGVVRVALPLRETERALAANNVILVLTGLGTAVLAMIAAYAIVRYIIVKPVLHLKDVSDRIARGMLDLRADIRTGDEFEELSHAFNRMLRHLVTVQDELRGVNKDLDSNVDELAHVNLQLYEMNKLKDEFLATMSHELRTPLNSILGFSDILANAKNLDEKQIRYVQNITLSGHDLMARINDVLDLAKIESGKMDLQPVEFALHDIVEKQMGSLAPQAGKKNIDLSVEISETIPELFQDPTKFQQILNNLLSNAIKFTPTGGRVSVRAEPCDGDKKSFKLTVEDTGVGIRLEEQETIFEKFRQGKLIPGQENTMTREYEGTGLGLSIVKELSRLLGGEVSLESEFGKGSSFFVRLPVRLPVVERQRFINQTRDDMVGINRPLQSLPGS
jgi:two-component system, NarL family, sensor histidine kinase BarA